MKIANLLIIFLPWRLKRHVLIWAYGYDLSRSARIGVSWVFPKMLIMGAGSRIASGVVGINLDKMSMGEFSSIGRFNWITGFPTGTRSKHFSHEMNRRSELIMGKHSAITKWHHVDCTSLVRVGDYTTVAGYYTQILTHSIDLRESRQASSEIHIGNYCFIGTNVVLLGGAFVSDYSVVGAKSLVRGRFPEKYVLISGVPASVVAQLSPDLKYFRRESGFIY